MTIQKNKIHSSLDSMPTLVDHAILAPQAFSPFVQYCEDSSHLNPDLTVRKLFLHDVFNSFKPGVPFMGHMQTA